MLRGKFKRQSKTKPGWRRYHKKRQNGKCYFCGVPMDENGPWSQATLDHLVPLSRGGEDHLENTVAACMRCNKEKGNEGPDWKPKRKSFV